MNLKVAILVNEGKPVNSPDGGGHFRFGSPLSMGAKGKGTVMQVYGQM